MVKNPACSDVIFQLHGLRVLEPTRFQRMLTYIMHGLVLCMIPVGYSVPSVSIFTAVKKCQRMSTVHAFILSIQSMNWIFHLKWKVYDKLITFHFPPCFVFLHKNWNTRICENAKCDGHLLGGVKLVLFLAVCRPKIITCCMHGQEWSQCSMQISVW